MMWMQINLKFFFCNLNHLKVAKSKDLNNISWESKPVVLKCFFAQSTGAAENTDCFSAEG